MENKCWNQKELNRCDQKKVVIRRREGVRAIADRIRCIRPPLVTRKKHGLKLDDDDEVSLTPPKTLNSR